MGPHYLSIYLSICMCVYICMTSKCLHGVVWRVGKLPLPGGGGGKEHQQTQGV